MTRDIEIIVDKDILDMMIKLVELEKTMDNMPDIVFEKMEEAKEEYVDEIMEEIKDAYGEYLFEAIYDIAWKEVKLENETNKK